MEDFPAFAVPGSEPPRNQIFSALRNIWLSEAPEGERRTSTGLAETLSASGRTVLPQHVSQWASGSDGRRPPWWVIHYLLHVTGSKIIFEPNSLQIVRTVLEEYDG